MLSALVLLVYGYVVPMHPIDGLRFGVFMKVSGLVSCYGVSVPESERISVCTVVQHAVGRMSVDCGVAG